MINRTPDMPTWFTAAVLPVLNRFMGSRTLTTLSKTNLPPATPAGQQAFIEPDKKPAYADGSNWRWHSDNTVVS